MVFILSFSMLLASCVSENASLSALNVIPEPSTNTNTNPNPVPGTNVLTATSIVYRANLALGTISVGSINHVDGSLGEIEQVQTGAGGQPKDILINHSRTIMYVANYGTAKIRIFRIDQQTGKLTFISDTETYAGPARMVLHPNGQFLYVLHETNSMIYTFAVNAESGQLTFKNKIATDNGNGSRAIQIDHTGTYVIANASSTTKTFVINKSNGALTPTGYELTQSYNALKIHPNGRFYGAAALFNKFWGIDLNLGNGSIETTSTSYGNMQSPYSNIVFSKDGYFGYAINKIENSVEVFSVNSDGSLSRIQDRNLPSMCYPEAVDIYDDESFLFIGCNDLSGRTLSLEIREDGKLDSTIRTSSVYGAQISDLQVLAL